MIIWGIRTRVTALTYTVVRNKSNKASHTFLYQLSFHWHDLKTTGICIFLKPYLEKYTSHPIHYATCSVPTHLWVYKILNCQVIWRELRKLFCKSSKHKSSFVFIFHFIDNISQQSFTSLELPKDFI